MVLLDIPFKDHLKLGLPISDISLFAVLFIRLDVLNDKRKFSFLERMFLVSALAQL